jgi:hypothetical protein
MHRFTRLSDITGIASPTEAPPTIRFSSALMAIFETQRRRSFPAGKPKEQGGTIVADANGNFRLQNIGGYMSDSVSFFPDFTVDRKVSKVVGIFHTHPFGKDDNWMTGASHSGGDIVHLIQFRYLLSVVQSGPRLFAAVRTAKTPNWINADLHTEMQVRIDARTTRGQPFPLANRIETQRMAAQYGLAYYQGGNGIVTRV